MLGLTMGVSMFFGGQVFAQVPGYVPSNGLVGWWPFNGNANDESGNGNDGTVNGATLTTDRFGNAGKAYSFDGVNSFIKVLNSSHPTGDFDITYSVWINCSDLNQDRSIISVGLPYGLNARSGIHKYNSGNLVYVVNGTDYISSYLSTLSQWHHIVFSKSSTLVSVYIDGIYFEQGNLLSALNITINDINFGGNGDNQYNNGEHFQGLIDDIGIWNRVLTDQEISNLYNGCSASTISNQPINQTVNPTNSANFIVNANSGSSFQWQTDLGLGFQNLSNAGQYSGANNDTLVVSNATVSNNNQQFRCVVNSGSCADTSSIAILTVSAAGIEELISQGNFNLYPNPTQSSFEIQTNLLFNKIEIIDMQGRVVKTENSGKIINIAFLQKGTYLVQLIDEKSKVIAVQRIIKE